MTTAEYRRRVYAEYAGAERGVPAPETLADLAPAAPYLRRMIAQHFPADRSARILDLGCGPGVLVHFAREAGYAKAEGVDGSPSQVAVAERLGIPVRAGDIHDALAALPPESLDVAISFDVLEHLTKDEMFPFADAVHRVLKPGGRWIIHVPNGASPFFGAVHYADLTHEWAFTPESLSQLVLGAGFSRATFHEDAPVAHGLKSAVRLLVWRIIRGALSLYVLAETGTARGLILSRNLLAVAYR